MSLTSLSAKSLSPGSTSRNRAARNALAAVLVLVLAATGAGAADRWFHVHVSETGDDPVEVHVNLPLTLIESALRVIPDEINAEVEAELNDIGVELEELRKFWEEVRNLEDATFVTVESEDENVHIAKQGDYLIAHTTESGENGAEVNVRLPFEVLAALFSGDTQIDLPAALRAIAEHSDGDLVTVSEGDTHVRIWVDDENDPTI